MKSPVIQVGETKIVTFDHIPVPHGCSTRVGGVSKSHLESLNTGFTVGDSPSNVWENRARFSAHLGVENLPWLLSMDHGTQVVAVSAAVAVPSDKTSRPSTHYQADGCVTNVVGLPLSLTVADCVPVFFHDPVVRAVGVTHAGWRGTVGGIVGETVKCLSASYGTDPQDVRVGIGPSIGPEAFEVGPEVVKEFRERFPDNPEIVRDHPDPVSREKGKAFVDLWQANLVTALWAGVARENISICGWCTVSHPELFFSHRRDRGKSGRLLAGIVLR
jgi:purine-nucleoside/S-methyl-5'-thioadenosine phosphorylase / adenosine deaminase